MAAPGVPWPLSSPPCREGHARLRFTSWQLYHWADGALNGPGGEAAAGDEKRPAGDPIENGVCGLSDERARRRSRFLRGNAVIGGFYLATGLMATTYEVAMGRGLGPAAYADVNTVLAMAVIAGVAQGVLQLLVAGEVGRTGAVSLRWARVSLVAGASLAAMGVLLDGPARALWYLPRGAFLAMALMSALWLLLAIQRGVAQGQEDYVTLGSSVAVEAAVRLVLTLELIGPLGFWGAVIALGGGSLASSIYTFARVRIPWRPVVPTAWVDVGFMAAGLGLAAVLPTMDLLIVKHAWPVAWVGAWTGMRLFGKGIMAIPTLVATVLYPRIVRDPKARSEYRLWAGLLAAGLMGLVALGASVVMPRLIRLFFAGRYLADLQGFLLYVWAVIPLGIFGLLVNEALAARDRWAVAELGAVALLYLLLLVGHHARMGDVLGDMALLGVLEVAHIVRLRRRLPLVAPAKGAH